MLTGGPIAASHMVKARASGIDMDEAAGFLAACRASSAATYRHFEELLARLVDPTSRSAARRLLHGIETILSRPCEQALPVTVERLSLGRRDLCEETLVTLHFPSVFAPEAWSRTFYEGLTRLPAGEFEGRSLAELGCGNGWISLALARRRSAPEKIFGLDINPKATLCARLNLYLNALTPEGELIRDRDGKSLLDRVEFHTSDLLAWVRRQPGLKLDRVIGCIPQVLRPDLTGSEEISARASDELLLSLSNYTGRQGYLEDQFGLGLIARALEEAIEFLRPGGRVVFNLGGRPGRAILDRLFRRRGFAVREVWSTKIRQTADTDISPLVEIEKNSLHRFEFFLGFHSDEAVNARTAQAFASGGGEIWHSLTVFEAWLRFPEPTSRIFGALRGAEWRPVRDALDLSYDEDAVAEEKIMFLARLADLLEKRACVPYGATAGEPDLRCRLTEFLRSYFAIPLRKENFVVVPNRECALRNLFTLYAPSRALVHPTLLAGAGLASGTEVLECPTRIDLACKLIEVLRPQLIATTLDEIDRRTPDSFLRLIETAGRTGARLVVDVSPFFELESTPRSNGVFQALAERALPAHVAILCGLVRNRVYRDLELCFLIAENLGLLSSLTSAAEVTYSRVPLFTQDYYEAILADLLSFRLDDQAGPEPRPLTECDDAAEREHLAAPCRIAFDHPAIRGERLAQVERRDVDVVRMDYGENALASPTLVKAHVFEAFARREITAAEADPAPEVALFLRRRFGLGATTGLHAPYFTYGLGVAPLFASLAEACASEQGTFVVPTGSYGEFVAAIQFFGASMMELVTYPAWDFKITPADLDRAFHDVARPWLYLNAPVANPAGGVYSGDDVAALLAVAARHRARVVLDVIFSGLEFEDPVPWDLDAVLTAHSLDLVVLGGISKELAAGGIRFGFAWCRSEEMDRALARGVVARPHRTMLYAARRILAGLNHLAQETRNQLLAQRHTLKRRAEELARILTDCGWQPHLPRGGLFLVARPAEYLAGGRCLQVKTNDGLRDLLLDDENLSEAMFWSVGLLINNSRWTGIDQYCRFVFAVEENLFEEGLRKVKTFQDLTSGYKT